VVTKKDKHLAAAQKYLERGSFEKALAMFLQAVKEDPKDTRTWLRMAEVYVRLGHNDKATEVYQKTVDLYVEQGFFQRAVAVYKNIIKLSPDFVDARIKLADVFRQLGLLSDAVQHLEQAAALYQKSNRIPEALSALKQIIDLNPDQPNPRIRYAEMASGSGAIKEAIVEFAEAAKLVKAQGRIDEFLRVAERLLHYEPENHAMSMEVASKYLDHNNARAALSRLKPVFEAKQRAPEVLDLLARTFEQLGQPHKTLPVLKELARVYAEAGRIGERNQTIQRVLAMDPNDQEMREMLGRSHGSQYITPHPPSGPRLITPGPMPSLTPLPIATAKRQVTITFSEMEVPPALRNKYVSPPGDAAPASMSERLNIASDMVEKSEDDAELKRILAESDVFVKYGLVERAADHLRRVFERVPTHQGAHERLAAVLVQLNRKAEAAAEYEVLAQQCMASKPSNAVSYARKALDLNPTARRALEVLGQVEGSMPTSVATKSEASSSSELRMGTPEPELIESEEIELLGESIIESDEFSKMEGDHASEAVGTYGAVTNDSDDYANVVFESHNNKFSSGQANAFEEEATDGGPMNTKEEGQANPSPMLEVEAQYEDGPEPGLNSKSADDEFMAEMEQVDFFIEQGLTNEALAMLDELEGHAPGHRLIAERRLKLTAFNTNPVTSQGAVPAQVHGDLTDPSHHAQSIGSAFSVQNTQGRQEHDIETHADLGIMEKTMERYPAAIEHFKALFQDPKREVFALSMIGECHEALGDLAKAIRCYQDALKRPSATTDEATQLYYQLGSVFYNMGDQSEALYYFERVYKRDANFRDIQRRLAELKSHAIVR
jgi:tetratricopeptide (TPR) repeat protein